MKEPFETTHEITNLSIKSPKRDAKLDAIKNEAKIVSNSEEDHTEAITLLCSTRWTVRAEPSSSIMSTYLKELWEWAAKSCSDTEMKAHIHGVNVYMKTFNYVYRVYLGELILCYPL